MKIALIVFQVCISSLGFAEVVSVNYHVENDRGVPIRDAEVMTTTQKDYLVLPCIGSTKHKKYIVDYAKCQSAANTGRHKTTAA